jgi:hypothetical protein
MAAGPLDLRYVTVIFKGECWYSKNKAVSKERRPVRLLRGQHTASRVNVFSISPHFIWAVSLSRTNWELFEYYQYGTAQGINSEKALSAYAHLQTYMVESSMVLPSVFANHPLLLPLFFLFFPFLFLSFFHVVLGLRFIDADMSRSQDIKERLVENKKKERKRIKAQHVVHTICFHRRFFGSNL